MFEALEDRGLLSASSSLPWPDPGHLTLSFAPDGTAIGAETSVLHQTLGTRLSSSAWQSTMLRAFQSWAAQTNANFGLTTDLGQPAGLAAALQGKLGQGDVRISARPLDPASLAITVPFDLFNAWSGTVVFNSTATFGDGSNSTQDLFAAALHEAGHIMGLSDSDDPTSAMYFQATAGRTGPSAADITAVRAIYGTRQPDAYEGWFGNDSLWTPTRLSYLASSSDTSALNAAIEADLTTASDRDTFLVTTPWNANTPTTISVRAAGLSLVTARVTAFDLLGQVVATTSTVDPLRNDLSLTLPSNLPGSTFFVRVEASQPGVFGIGSYRIAAGAGSLPITAAAPTMGTNRGVSDDGGRNDSAARATTLRAAASPADPRWTYTVRAGITNSTDVDYYRFKTDVNTPPVLLVNVGGLQASGLTPRVDVLDRNGNPIASQLLNHDAGSSTVQVLQVEPNTTYLVRVAAFDPAGAHATGRYFLGIDLRQAPLPFVGFASGALQGRGTGAVAAVQDFRTLEVNRTLLFRFDLSATGGGAANNAAVRAIIYDAQRRPVFALRAFNGGNSATGDVLLGPGVYTVRFVAATRTGTPLPMLLYRLKGVIRSDPVGPAPVDTTLYPTGTGDTPDDPYDWSDDDPNHGTYLSLTDPLSDPWTY